MLEIIAKLGSMHVILIIGIYLKIFIFWPIAAAKLLD
jgi:hypothetical protein